MSAVSPAILLAGPGAAGADPRLVAALRAQGVDGEIAELAGPAAGELPAELARLAADGPVAVARADLVISSTPIGALLDDPRVRSGVLVADAAEGADLCVQDGEVQAVPVPGDPAAGAAHLGLVRLHPDDVAAAKGTAAAPGGADPLRALTAALLSGGVRLRAVPLGGYVWAHPSTAAEADDGWRRVAALDEHAVRLAEAARSGDGLYSSLVVRRISRRLTAVALRLRLQPDPVTLVSLGLGLLAAACFAAGARPVSVAGAVLLQAALVVDCVDGELARYRRRFSARGAWLDATTDRVKELAAIGGLAVGAARSGADVWLLAGAAVAVQTFRNLFDLGWAMQRADDAAGGRVAPPMPPVQALAPSVTAPRLVGPARTPPAVWARRVAHFPVGERLLLMSLGAAFATPRWTLLALLAVGGGSALYMIAAYAARAAPVRVASPRLAGLVDIGVLEAPLRRVLAGSSHRLAPVLPAGLALAELGGLVALTATSADRAMRGSGYLLVAAVSFGLYDRAYRSRDGARAGAQRSAGVLAVLALTATAAALPAGWVGILLLAVGVATFALLGSLRADRADRPARGEGGRG